MSAKHEKYLLDLTGLPTAAGREDHVIAYIEQWARRKRSVRLQRDRYGNLLLKRADARSRKPILITAHMDHPAFVVVQQLGPRRVLAEFRGGVHNEYFVNSRVRLHLGGLEPVRGRVVNLDQPEASVQFKQATIELTKTVVAEAGDILTWDLPSPKITRGRLHAPACDDLAGAAAALAAFEVLLKKTSGGASGGTSGGDVRVLLTRAEEVGFVGAIGACKSGLIPKGARLIALEASKSFAESPIGGGPIIRVGDRTSSFDPDLTYRVGRVAQAIEERDAKYNWQRKLMPGGTCEASAYQSYGLTATCVCLPLGNYHNMCPLAETPEKQRGKRSSATRTSKARIGSEVISIADYHGLIRLLVEIGKRLDDPKASPMLKDRLESLFAQRRYLLD